MVEVDWVEVVVVRSKSSLLSTLLTSMMSPKLDLWLYKSLAMALSCSQFHQVRTEFRTDTKFPSSPLYLNNKGGFILSVLICIVVAYCCLLIISGFNAPRRSVLLVHPDEHGSRANTHELNISSPDYSGVARAVSDGHIHAVRVSDP